MRFNELTEQIFGLKLGIPWQGGIIAYLDESKNHGLIMSEFGLSNVNWDEARLLCSFYRGGGFDDWRLPTKDELNKLYIAHQLGIGRFGATSYWSSSGAILGSIWSQDFYNGVQSFSFKHSDSYVRAVRSF